MTKSDWYSIIGITFIVSVVWTLMADVVTNGSGILFVVAMILLIVKLFQWGHKKTAIGILAGWLGLGIISLIHSYQPSGRFQPIAGLPKEALDTRTGQRCLTGDKPKPNLFDTPASLPYCSDLK